MRHVAFLAFLAFLSLSVLAQTPPNLALRAIRATASSWRPEYPPKDAIDGDMKTSFSVALGAKTDQWFQLDWDSPQTIGGFAFWQPDRYTESFDVQLLEQGKWVTVAHGGTPGPKLGRNVFVWFQPQPATSMRLANILSTEVGGCAFYEIAVYADPRVVENMENAVDVAVAGDTTGRLIGTASIESGSQGVVGASVTVDGAAPIGEWTRHAVTDEHGFFTVDMPLNPVGPIRVHVTQGDRRGDLEVNASDIAQRLTPRPLSGRLDLDGEWEFLPDPPKDFAKHTAGLAWKPIKVPSCYEMQGYRTKTDTAALRRFIEIPEAWAGKRIRLRPESIYSYAEVWLNGQRVGSHEGGATPFELDVTKAAKPGQKNELCVFIKARSRSADIDHMSVYAYYEVAGIWRHIEMFALEPSHIARLTYAVHFDPDYKNADLSIDVKLANEHDVPAAGNLRMTLLDPAGKEVKTFDVGEKVGAWEAKTDTFATEIKQPQQWSAELPRTYKLLAEWHAPGQPPAKMEIPVGFRQVEIKGRSFEINGKPVRLFGTCLHSADPLDGRAIPNSIVRKDLELIKEANFNAIRTSHYPPNPLTPFIADEIGIYIEDEGPSCWGDGNEDLRNAPMYMGIVSEYLERDRNHPSVVYWSTCNESDYGIIFQLAHRYAKKLDPTRPVGGSYAPLDMDNDIYVLHHPTNIYDHILETDKLNKPVFYDECLTVPHGWNDLAHSEEVDPGMHDMWEWKIPLIRREIMDGPNQVGTMSWAWVDDAFLVPGRGVTNSRLEMPQILYADPIYKMPGRGYQGDTLWGMVDGWRRPRPEWWEAKKVYSPILIEEKPLAIPAAGQPVVIPVENMNWFANLSHYTCHWSIGDKSGKATASVPPSTKGTFEISIGVTVKPEDVLTLKWYDETGRLVDAYNLTFRPHPVPVWKMDGKADTSVEDNRYLSGARAVYLRAANSELAMDQTSGGLMWALKDDEEVLTHGPVFHILRSDDALSQYPKDWKFASETHGPGEIHWNGAFGGDEFVGGYTIRMDCNGQLQIDYSFTYKGPDLYAREIGLQFEAPLAFDRLTWDKHSEHSYYPPDHIGRPDGTAVAHPDVAQSVPPNGRPFALDDHPWGCNDFRSTKQHIYWATVTNALGQGIKVVSDGSQDVRAAVGVHGVAINVLDYWGGSGPPGHWSVEGFHYGPGHLIKSGDVLKGTVRMQLLGARR
ncbi:MAG TPA: glycoside hydrolase family 2 TIM barrel-domain containing protein [Fimbriimonadaceae bacterium]|nr:glycoside hydrolase family 2 TIM barrel-domain containing protein [Fimbriimonadaceae bacterium]